MVALGAVRRLRTSDGAGLWESYPDSSPVNQYRRLNGFKLARLPRVHKVLWVGRLGSAICPLLPSLHPVRKPL